jgi:predicted nucleic acid-binding protein
MRYLLDVNALIAFGIPPHQFHHRISDWIKSQRGSVFLTCSIVEIGFVRIIANVPAYGLDTAGARTLLLGMKKNKTQPLAFLPDPNDISQLPEWANSPARITDGHLAKLATTHGAILATLDKGIPGSLLIP